MITEDDLILVENAMEKSINEIGYLLTTKSGKKIVSSISINDIFEKAKNENYKYLLVLGKEEKEVLKKINIEKIKKNVDKNFVIYIATKNEIKEYKI